MTDPYDNLMKKAHTLDDPVNEILSESTSFFEEHTLLAAEDLHPDLLPFLEENGALGAQLRHPLVYQVPLFTNGHANKMYAHKIEQLERARAEDNFSLAIYLHERPYRLQAFTELIEEYDVPDKIFWEILGDVFTDSENVWQNRKTWKMLLTSDRPFRNAMMRPDDVLVFEALPEVVTIYRGCNYANRNGLSWTLSKDTAAFFANRFHNDDNTGLILEAQVKKSEVVALLNHRSEQEILLLHTPDYKKAS